MDPVVGVVATLKHFVDFIFTSSDEESDDTADEELQRNPFLQQLKLRLSKDRRPPNRISNFVSFVIPRYSGNQFQQHFRLNRAAFQALLNRIEPLLINMNQTGRSTIQPKKQLLSVLWLLANQESYR